MSDPSGTFGASSSQPNAGSGQDAAPADFFRKQPAGQESPAPRTEAALPPPPTEVASFGPIPDQGSFGPPPTQAAPIPAMPGQQMPGQPMAQPGTFQPSPGGALESVMPSEPVLVSIGDISVTATQVYTPSGNKPLTDVQWTVTDMSATNEGIPTWAIVCAVVFFLFCFLGLLFLLVKETTTKGAVQVTVHGPGFVHTTQVPVFNPAQIADLHARVNYVRTLVASAPGSQQSFQGGQPQGPVQQPGYGQQNYGQQGFGQQPGQGW